MIDTVALQEFVESNPKLVTRKESTRYPGLFVLKYSRKVFYDNLWETNPLLLECRGLVVDAGYNVIVKPFTKVFNHGENGTTFDPDTLCTVVRKVNGFMACATKVEGYSELIISTTGSLDSDHVDIAKKHINADKDKMVFGETYIFEICDPDDPHIVQEEPGAYLIGGGVILTSGTEIKWSERTLNLIAKEYDMLRPSSLYNVPFSQVLIDIKTVQHEGFMVYDDSGKCLKLKSPYYLTTKFLARMRDEKLAHILNQGDIRQSMRNFDEEYYPLIQYLAGLKEGFYKADEQSRIKIIEEYFKGK